MISYDCFLLNVTSFHRFLSDYDEQFPVADDVSLLQQALPDMYPYQLPCNYFCKHLALNQGPHFASFTFVGFICMIQ